MNLIRMNKQQLQSLNTYDVLKDVVKKRSDGSYTLPNSKFYRKLIDYPKPLVNTSYSKIPDLYSFQSECIHHMRKGRLLVNLSPGLGKTYVACTHIKIHNIKNVLIIAPKALHYVWEDHIKKIVGVDPEIRSQCYEGGIVVTNIQQLGKINFILSPYTVFIDESITIKNRKSKSWKLCKQLVKDLHPEQVYLLSGSPYSRTIDDLWSQLNLLFPSDFTSYWDFAKLFCRVAIDRYGWKIVENRKDIEPLLKYSLSDYMYSVHIDDVTELPDYTETIIDIEPSTKQLSIYKQWKAKGEAENIKIDGPLSLLTRYKQLSLAPLEILDIRIQSPKLNILREMLEYVDLPCIIVSTSNAVLSYLNGDYKNSCIFNADNPKEYEEYLSGEKQIMFMQLQSGKYGHSFINTKTMIYLDYNFNADDLYQSLARVKRLTSTLPCTIYHLHCMKIDKVMFELAKERNLSVDTVLRKVEE